ncbi:MAG: hypothetical protein JO264_02960 [Acidisphaera sp.]|nr:hypothetical protein [Acidisphaera sp.]
MDLEAFRGSLSASAPPPVGLPLQALWWAAKGDWDRAHKCAQEGEDADSCWVHAWLHRQEGDLSNAGYWYARAGRARSETSVEQEWTEIATALTERS